LESSQIIQLTDVSKAFGKNPALHAVNFRVDRGEVVSLVGDNGAGKSTLAKIIAGIHEIDQGEMLVHGRKVTKWSASDARREGIETVYQDKALAEQQTIARNIFMGREPTGRFGFIKLAYQAAEAERLMRQIGFTSKVFAADSIVANLSGGEKQGVAMARALYFDAQLIILDEPTAALSLKESNEVLRFIRKVRDEGHSAIFISHNIYHACEVCDRLVALDRGRVVFEAGNGDLSPSLVIERLNSAAETGTLK
jgi:simple sugar transport system ATP-binding protein